MGGSLREEIKGRQLKGGSLERNSEKEIASC